MPRSSGPPCTRPARKSPEESGLPTAHTVPPSVNQGVLGKLLYVFVLSWCVVNVPFSCTYSVPMRLQWLTALEGFGSYRVRF